MGCALGKNHVVEPFFFKDRVINADSYLDILQNYFIPQLKQLNLKHNAMFQQDGVPCRFALRVKQFLNREFPDRLIGKNVTLCIANNVEHVES